MWLSFHVQAGSREPKKSHSTGLLGIAKKAEDKMLNTRLISFRKSNARKSEFRANDYERLRAGFRAIEGVSQILCQIQICSVKQGELLIRQGGFAAHLVYNIS